jgi:hypothetical protein
MMTPGRHPTEFNWRYLTLIVAGSTLLVMAIAFLSQMPLVVK